uniref:Uncharacterized protein n=1 Tax=Plectus sambesii TaxID=2011161 RepID=A0A914WVP0_9BILA
MTLVDVATRLRQRPRADFMKRAAGDPRETKKASQSEKPSSLAVERPTGQPMAQRCFGTFGQRATCPKCHKDNPVLEEKRESEWGGGGMIVFPVAAPRTIGLSTRADGRE